MMSSRYLFLAILPNANQMLWMKSACKIIINENIPKSICMVVAKEGGRLNLLKGALFVSTFGDLPRLF